jgi:hypothetical protein
LIVTTRFVGIRRRRNCSRSLGNHGRSQPCDRRTISHVALAEAPSAQARPLACDGSRPLEGRPGLDGWNWVRSEKPHVSGLLRKLGLDESSMEAQAFRSRADELESLDRMLALRRPAATRRCAASRTRAHGRGRATRACPTSSGQAATKPGRVHAETAPSSLTQRE